MEEKASKANLAILDPMAELPILASLSASDCCFFCLALTNVP